MTGGTLSYTQYPRTWRGLNQVYTFNPWTETWQRQSDMRHGRWYPTQVELPDGRTLITSGLDETGNASGPDTPLNKDVEIFDPADGSVKLATGADTPLNGMYPHMWQMPSGKVLVAGPYREDSFFLSLTGATSYSVTDVANPALHHYWGTGVLVPNQPNKAMLIGGSDRVTGIRPAPPTARVRTSRSSTRTTRAPAGRARARSRCAARTTTR